MKTKLILLPLVMTMMLACGRKDSKDAQPVAQASPHNTQHEADPAGSPEKTTEEGVTPSPGGTRPELELPEIPPLASESAEGAAPDTSSGGSARPSNPSTAQPGGIPPGGTGTTSAPKPPEQKLPRIRILNSEILVAIDTSDPRSLMLNAFSTTTQAMAKLMDRGVGIYCQSANAKEIQAGDVLTMIDGDIVPHAQDQTVNVTTFKYQTADKKKNLSLICTSRGKVSTQDFEDNFKTIIQFSDSLGSFESHKNPNTETPEEAAKNDEKRKSFKIVNLEVLKKIVVPEKGMLESLSLMNGKLIKGEEAQTLIMEGKAEEACQISKLEGKLLTDRIYKLVDSEVLAGDRENQIALLRYHYEADEKNKIHLDCVVRMSTPATEILNVFKSVLEFGPQE